MRMSPFPKWCCLMCVNHNKVRCRNINSRNGNSLPIGAGRRYCCLKWIRPRLTSITRPTSFRMTAKTRVPLPLRVMSVPAHRCLLIVPAVWGMRLIEASGGTLEGFESEAPYSAIFQGGVYNGNSAVSERDIGDGMTNTLMFGESAFGFWADSHSAVSGFVTSTGGTNFHSGQNFDGVPERSGQTGAPYHMTFGSWHGDLVHFALCDGSAKSMATNIDRNLFRQLCIRNDGERMTGEW